jgi:hypothetical protein
LRDHGPPLIHRTHRDRDEGGRIIADIARDYAPVRELMNALLAENAGVAVRQTITETVVAVGEATLGQVAEEGADAKTIGKILKLDKSAARRRLLAAQDEGFVENYETRPGRPGRYGLTRQKGGADDNQMLPSADALYLACSPPKNAATLPPGRKSKIRSRG